MPFLCNGLLGTMFNRVIEIKLVNLMYITGTNICRCVKDYTRLVKAGKITRGQGNRDSIPLASEKLLLIFTINSLPRAGFKLRTFGRVSTSI